MSIMDMAYRGKWRVARLREYFRSRRFSAIVLDNRAVGWELSGLSSGYKLDELLPTAARPHVYSGAGARYKRGQAVRTASAVQVRQPIYRDSVNRWKNYARHILPLHRIIEKAD